MPVEASDATILPASSKPAGNLEVLPREIRDEIYGYVLGTTDYDDFVYDFEERLALHMDSEVPLALHMDSSGTTRLQWDDGFVFPPILKLSKRIRQEAMEFLYSKGVFWVHGSSFPSTIIKDILLMDRIMNVTLSIDLTLEERLKVTSLFAGTQVLRGTFTEERHLSLAEKGIMNPPMIETVKQLIGFKIVTVLIFCEVSTWLDDLDTRFNALAHELRRALEPALGPSTKQSLEVKGRPYDIAVVFHPRDYLSRKTQAAKESEIQQKDHVTHFLFEVSEHN